MKYYVVLFLFVLTGCQGLNKDQAEKEIREAQTLEQKNKELELKEKELQLKERELEMYKQKEASLPPKLKDVYQNVKPSVYLVYTLTEDNLSQGSAFVISEDGIAISNFHVFAKASDAILINENDDEFLINEILDYSEEKDYIIFRIEHQNKQLPFLKVAAYTPEVGENCFAVGNPEGLTQTLSTGIISSFRGSGKIIQTTTEITHGSSGGPLFNENGEVIGITSFGRGEANLNFAINMQNIPYQRYLSTNAHRNEKYHNEGLTTEQVRKLLSTYYTSFEENNFDRLSLMYADRLTRFFSLFDISRAEAIKKNMNYDKMFKVTSKKLGVRWDSMAISRKSNGSVVVNIIIDWEIERLEKSKPTKFVVYHTIGMNSEGKITSIYEDILKKE